MVVVILIEDVSTLLMMLKDCCWSSFRCCVVVYVSRLPLLLPLSDLVPVAAAVVFLLHLEGGHHGDKDIDGGYIDILVDVDNGLLLRSKTNKHMLDCNCN